MGDGSRSSLRPIRAGELRSHSAGYEPNAPYGPRGMRENRGRSPRMGDGGEVFLPINPDGRPISTSTPRVTMNKWLLESHSSPRSKLQRQLGKKSSVVSTPESRQFACRTVCRGGPALPAPRTTAIFFAQARLRTVESALGTEYASAQQNLQQQYLTQAKGLHNELQTAQRHFSDQLAQERAAKGQETEALRRKLAETAQLIGEQANDLQQNAKLHRERS